MGQQKAKKNYGKITVHPAPDCSLEEYEKMRADLAYVVGKILRNGNLKSRRGL